MNNLLLNFKGKSCYYWAYRFYVSFTIWLLHLAKVVGISKDIPTNRRIFL